MDSDQCRLGSGVSRRRFVQLGAIALLPAWLGCRTGPVVRHVPAEADAGGKLDSLAPLTVPDFSRVKGTVAGLRPFRRAGVRIELDQCPSERPLVHHYGHGGSGVTVSWGTAELAVDRLDAATSVREVTVLGGVIGLTTAAVLLERGYEVRVVADRFLNETTSYLAGAQWAPSWIRVREGLDSVLRRSHARFAALESDEWGVSRRPNYARDPSSSVFRMPKGLFPQRQKLDRLPFPGPVRGGYVQETFLIEPPVYLPRLQHELEASGVVFERRRILHVEELETIAGDALVDCLGLGAGSLFDDGALMPVRGQLVHLEPGDHPYLLSHWGYVFPRRDAVLLGGTFERGVSDPTPNPETCRRLRVRHAHFFGIDVS